jgi:hypothetical protein
MFHRPYERAFIHGGVKNATISARVKVSKRDSTSGSSQSRSTYPGPAREGSGIIMDVRASTMLSISSHNVAGSGESESPISNGLPVTVAVKKS